MSASSRASQIAGDNSCQATRINKRVRAKYACRECNARRVKCNVTESRPCSNCDTAGINCEVLPSRRGRYLRGNRKKQRLDQPRPATTSPSVQEADRTSCSSPVQASLAPTVNSDISHHSENDCPDTIIIGRSPSSPAVSGAPATLFFGESNFLTLVPRRPHHGEVSDSQDDQSKQKARLLFPMNNTPQTLPEGESPANIEHLSAGTSRYLRDEGAMTLPDLQACVPALQAYFTWFHPCFPVLDRAEFTRKLLASQVSYILLQAMLFIGATYCDNATITSMGFSNRTEAKSLFYTRARLLFHADWEKDQITLIQSLFLMSFWRGGPSDVRDVRYWLGVAIGVAESRGLHRSTRLATRDPQRARIRKRIWWSIYVRERQAATSLGLPSRIKDDDCDVEHLTPSDLESEADTVNGSPFGFCKPEHIAYVISMVELTQILYRVVDLHFTPGRQPSTLEQLQDIDDVLANWRATLPEELNRGVEDGTATVWAYLLHLAYHHLRILLYRYQFVKQDQSYNAGQIAVAAASRISRIAEDMLAQGTLRYGQMHSITSLFAALCIHAISMRRSADVSQRIAENRAQMCLLGLQEIQKYWRINNNVLDLFLQYLDESIAQRLRGSSQIHSMTDPAQNLIATERQGGANETVPEQVPYDFPTPQTQAQTRAFEDQYFNLLYGPWEGDSGTTHLWSVLQANDTTQLESLDTLCRSL